MTPLEAVARAISFSVTPDESTTEDDWDFWIPAARAALTALRDAGVTEGMRDAAYDVRPSNDHDEIFRAMLDAVLEEG